MMATVDILILGAGWTSTFLIPLLQSHNISFAATTRSGSSTTIAFTFNPTSIDPTPFNSLPIAFTILITFPVTHPGGSQTLLSLYRQTHPNASPRFIQLGTTGIWPPSPYTTRHSPYTPTHPRALEEEALLQLGGCVLNLSGLWGGERNPQNWLVRVAPTKDALRDKSTLHLIHGQDVARAVLAVHKDFTEAERWLLTDLRVYDWWDLALAWGGETEKGWVVELMKEKKVGRVPREKTPDKALEGREFWERFGMTPSRGLISATDC